MKTNDEIKACICCIACQENAYIREWVEYNKSIGFCRIFLYDNNKSYEANERFEDVIGDYIESGFVKLIDRRDVIAPTFQTDCYNECYSEYGSGYDWMFFTDCDEFLTTVHFDNVADFLAQPKFTDFHTIKINWMSYNDNGNIYKTEGSVQERFPNPSDKTKTDIVWENRLLKSIVRCGLDINKIHIGIHAPVAVINGTEMTVNINKAEYRTEKAEIEKNLKWEYRACFANGDEVFDNCYPNCFSPTKPKYDDAYIRHYRTKSCEEYVHVKARRGFQDCSKEILNSGTYFYFNDYSEEKLSYLISQGLEKPVFLIDSDTHCLGEMMSIYAAAKEAMKSMPHDYNIYWKNNNFYKVSELLRNTNLFSDVTFFPQTVLNDIKYLKNCGEYHYVENFPPYNKYAHCAIDMLPGRNIRLRGERVSWKYYNLDTIIKLYGDSELLKTIDELYGVNFFNAAAVYVDKHTDVDELHAFLSLYGTNLCYILLYEDYNECAEKVSAAFEMYYAETGKDLNFMWLNRAHEKYSNDVIMLYTIAKCRVNFVNFHNPTVWFGTLLNNNDYADIIHAHTEDEIYTLLLPVGDNRYKCLYNVADVKKSNTMK